jgi:hypothetical protein
MREASMDVNRLFDSYWSPDFLTLDLGQFVRSVSEILSETTL